MTPAPVYIATGEEVYLAQQYHGGQSSMLYAVASTGALTPGNLYRDTLEERANLARWLWLEVREALRDAWSGDSFDPAPDVDTLEAWAAKLYALSEDLEAALEGVAA